MPKIYTKKGDDGCTMLYSGERLPKTNPIFDILRQNDELTSRIGLARSVSNLKGYTELDSLLEDTQKNLQSLNSDIATIGGRYYEVTRFNAKAVEATKILEEAIDRMTAKLPKLTTFILPGGSLLSSHLHLCRTATREAESRMNRFITVGDTTIKVAPEIKAYVNRLSDFFFTAARYVDMPQELGFRTVLPSMSTAIFTLALGVLMFNWV